MYCMKNIDGKESNTAKGVNIATEFDEFKDTLFDKLRRTKGQKHKLGICEINKLSFSCFDDKRFVLDGEIYSLAYFHEDIDSHK